MTIDTNATEKQRAVLAAVQLPGVSDEDHAASLAELGRLVYTLGYEVIGTVSQRRSSPAAAAVLGGGKLLELAAFTGGPGKVTKNIPRRKSKAEDLRDAEAEAQAEARGRRDPRSAAELARAAQAMVSAQDADDDSQDDDEGDEGGARATLPENKRAKFVIIDNELSPSQLRNLETAAGCDVMDRAGVIVEIFHRHAKTREARLQVEIARLRYLAPRLRLNRKASEREGGGPGSKGVGETAGELDKRKIRDRIAELERELEEIAVGQKERRSRRSDQLKIALVGYTNAGKSSLMRALTGSEVLVQDKLFATLDTTVRVMQPETTPKVLVSDTVGFIKKLPHDLVASFRSTLDEAHEAQLLLFVADASDKTFRAQLAVTREVIGEIGAQGIESRLILNKADRLSEIEKAGLKREFPDAIIMSTHAAADVAMLRAKVMAFFDQSLEERELFLPYAKTSLIGEIRRHVRVLAEDADENGMKLTVKGPVDALTRLKALIDA